MVARPGRLQSAWTAGELDPLLHERTELKYFSTGAAWAENVEIAPQGGFRSRDGLRDIGAVPASAARIFSFDASNGAAFDLVFSDGQMDAWGASSLVGTIATPIGPPSLPHLMAAQQLDTMICFHRDLTPRRIKYDGIAFALDTAPLTGIPNYDYGAVYTNGVAAVWRLQFIGLTDGSTVFIITVSGQDTVSVTYDASTSDMAADINTALLGLANISPGIVVDVPDPNFVRITFSGAGNEGDGWAVSVRIVNKADAAVASTKIVAGVLGGEPIISATRGWPACGTFFGQRLLIGGLKSLPNTWMMSKVADYYNFDERFTEANGSAVIPMDIPGGEGIVAMVQNLNLLIFTTKAEYWISERALSKTQAPNHVQASRHGSKRGVPIAENEGAALFIHANGGVLGEFRYTDVTGNFVATDISLLGSHLLSDVVDLALKRSTQSRDGNLLVTVAADGATRLVTILREQDVTAFARFTTPAGTIKAVNVNGRNELSMLVARPDGRRLERMEDGLLLDSAKSFNFGPPSAVVTGLTRYNDLSVWAIGDGHVFGPFTVAGGTITLPVAVSEVTVGTWLPPKVTTLPPRRDVGPQIVLKRPGRIHSVTLSLIDTTSVAIAANGGPLRDIELARYGAPADVPELSQAFTGEIKLSGLTGFAAQPSVTISQVRPGRLNVRSITIEAAL